MVAWSTKKLPAKFRNFMTLSNINRFFKLFHCLFSSRFGVANQSGSWLVFVISEPKEPDFSRLCVSVRPCILDCSVPQGSTLAPLKFISCTEDSAISRLISRYQLGYHLYADGTSWSVPLRSPMRHPPLTAMCYCRWRLLCLQANPSKTELKLRFGSRVALNHIACNGLSLRVGSDVMHTGGRCVDLGVTHYSELQWWAKVN